MKTKIVQRWVKMTQKYANIELIIRSNSTLTLGNSANYKSLAKWNNSENGNVTTIGTNGNSSPYGLYDSMGQVYEWTETSDNNFPQLKIIRGGSYVDKSSDDLIAIKRFLTNEMLEEGCFGFRLASSGNPLALSNFISITGINVHDSGIYNTSFCDNKLINNISLVDPKNLNDIGKVAYSYKISNVPVNNTKYCEFLNKIDPFGQNKELYDHRMDSSAVGGIHLRRSYENPTSGNYYTVKFNMDNKPATFITWEMAAKYCNWLTHNKTYDFNKLNNGAYDFSIPLTEYSPAIWNKNTSYNAGDIVQFSGNWYVSVENFITECPQGYVPENWYCCPDNINSAPTAGDCSPGYNSFDPLTYTAGWNQISKSSTLLSRTTSGTYFLPTNNEWHKAVLYSPTNKKYFKYGTSSNSVPSPIICNSSGSAYNVAGYFPPSEKIFPIVITKSGTPTTIDPNIFGLNISYTSTPADNQNNVFFITADVQGASTGLRYSYLYSSSSGTNWPAYISPISGTFVSDTDGLSTLNSVVKFCPLSRYQTNSISCSSNLSYVRNGDIIENNLDRGSGILVLNIRVSGIDDHLMINKNVTISGSNLPILPKNDVIDISLLTGSGNTISVSGDYCDEYIPIVAIAKPANIFTKIGEKYDYAFISSNNSITITPQSGQFGLSGDNTKITSILKLNNQKNTNIGIRVSKSGSDFTNIDYISVICLDKCKPA